jgi:hypothetical protein
MEIEGGIRREERGNVGDTVEVLVEALDDVGDEIQVGDQGDDLGQGINRRLLHVEVLVDGAILMLDIAKFLGEVDLAGLLVVVEEDVDSGLDRVRGGDGSVDRSRGGHDEVDDVHGHGAIEPAEDRGVGRGCREGEVILMGKGGDDDVEEGAPLGEDVGLEVEDDGDEGADALDGGGMRP